MCSGVRDEGEGEGRCASTRTSLCGLVLVFETRERERGGVRAPERARVGSFWCSRQGRGRGEVREHQNKPVWARSGVRDGEGCLNIRTSPHGLVLMFETRERKSRGA